MEGVLSEKAASRRASGREGPASLVCRAIERLGTGLVRHAANGAFAERVEGDAGRAAFGELVRAAYQVMFLWIARDRGAGAVMEGVEGARRWARLRKAAGALSGETAFAKERRAWGLPSIGGSVWRALALPDAIGDGEAEEAFGLLQRAAEMCLMQSSEETRDGLGVVYERLLTMRARVGDDGALVLEAARATGRKATGSYYTPDAVVEALLDSALEPTIEDAVRGKSGKAAREAILRLRVCDPACGSGRFLVAAAERLARRVARCAQESGERGTDLADAMVLVLRHCIHGVDVNPMAVEICRFSLWMAIGAGLDAIAEWGDKIRCGNALLGVPAHMDIERTERGRAAADRWCAEAAVSRGTMSAADVRRFAEEHKLFHWQLEFGELFDVVIGNPPFLNQLETTTATTRKVASLIEKRYERRVRGYQDLSATFLLLATQVTREGGRVALVQPQSLLAVGDAAPVRAAVLERGVLEALWVSNAHVFRGASVFTCAPTIRIGGTREGVLRRMHGTDFARLADVRVDADALKREPTWAHLVAVAHGVPEFCVNGTATLAEIADATADFRDQYYGLEGFIVEDETVEGVGRERERWYPRLITTGLIDLAACMWGDVPTRVLKREWARPRIDRRRMESSGELGPWMRARLVPKVMLATQTRVLEVVVDVQGRFVPSLPLITVMPKRRAMIWHVGAAVASPVCAAVAMQRYGGAALNVDAIKLSAKQVLTMPLPREGAAWDEGAAALRAAQDAKDERERVTQIRRLGERMCAAHGLSAAEAEQVMRWWSARLKTGGEGRKRARTDSNRRPAV